MIGALKVLTKRPSDKTIRISEAVFGLIYMTAMYYNLIYQGDAIETNFFGNTVSEANINYVKYGFIALGIIPLLRGLTGLNIIKSKYMRIAQITFGIILFYVSSKIVESANLEVDTLVSLMGFVAIISGITGKLITKSGLKHGQKITKIRV